jgi:hypothetical protein
LSQPGSEITGENLVQELKQAELGAAVEAGGIWIFDSALGNIFFFGFREVDQTRREGETQAPDGESGNGCGKAWRIAE